MKKKQNLTSKNTTTIIFLIFVFLLVVGVFAYKSAVRSRTESTEPTSTASTGKALLSKAKREGKPAYILFHSSTCLPCQEMEKIAKKVIPSFTEKIVFIEVNVNDPAEQDLINQFGIQVIPTSIFIGKNGDIREGTAGVIPEESLKAILKKLTEERL